VSASQEDKIEFFKKIDEEAREWRDKKYLEEPTHWCTIALKRMFKDNLNKIKNYVKRCIY